MSVADESTSRQIDDTELDPVERVLARLTGVKQTRTGYEAPCPCHDDSDPSLSINYGDEGDAVLYCHAKCKTVDILEAIGLSFRDLFVPNTMAFKIRDINGKLHATHLRKNRANGKKDMPFQLPDGTFSLNGRRKTSLPLYGSEHLAELPDGADLIVCEGEKATKAVRALGFAAVGTVTGAAGIPDDDVLKTVLRFNPLPWPDFDDAGREHMRRIADRLVALGGRASFIEWDGAHEKGDDAADFLERGGTAEQLRALIAAATPYDPHAERLAKLNIISAGALVKKQFKPRRDIIPDILPEGGILLVSPPKIGKSLLALGIALGVAGGGRVLGALDVDQGDVLYCDLENGERRIQERMLDILQGTEPPEHLYFSTVRQGIDDGLLDSLEAWVASVTNPRLIIIDVIAHIRPMSDGRRNRYDEDYSFLAPITKLAHDHDLCILLLHHTNRSRASDPMDRISGTNAQSGAVDGALLLSRTRGELDGELQVMHRDLDDRTFALRLEAERGAWRYIGDAADLPKTTDRKQIIDVLAKADRPLGAKEIADALGKTDDKGYAAVRQLLSRMMKGTETLLRKEGQTYRLRTTVFHIVSHTSQ